MKSNFSTLALLIFSFFFSHKMEAESIIEFTSDLFNVEGNSHSHNDSSNNLSTNNICLDSYHENFIVDESVTTCVTIGGDFWIDANGNGLQDGTPDEGLVGGVIIALIDDATGAVALDCNGINFSNQTGGSYMFENVPPGEYRVEIIALPGADWYMTIPHAAGGPTDAGDVDNDSDFDPVTLQSHLIEVLCGETDEEMRIDGGIFQAASLEIFAWNDSQNNGIYNDGETCAELGMDDIIAFTLLQAGVQAFELDGVTPATFTFQGGGVWKADNLAAGLDYTVTTVAPTSWIFTTLPHYDGSISDIGDGSSDSDFDPVSGSTPAFELVFGQTKTNISAGFYQNLILGGVVWVQFDDINGTFDGYPDEAFVSDIIMNLYKDIDGDGNFESLISTTITNANGKYEFFDLDPGNYMVEVDRQNFDAGTQLEVFQCVSDNFNLDNTAESNDGIGPVGTTNGGAEAAPIYLRSGCEVNGNENRTVDFGFFFEFDCTENNPDYIALDCADTDPNSASYNDFFPICDVNILNAFCATMSPIITGNGPTPLCDNGGAPHNISWFSFIAGDGDYTIRVTPGNCTDAAGNPPGTGIQNGIYTSCSFTEQVGPCVGIPCSQAPTEVSNIDPVTGELVLIPGNIYYWFMDGCSGTICEFEIDVIGDFITYQSECPAALIASDTSGFQTEKVCPGIEVTFSLDGFNTVESLATFGHEWSIFPPTGWEVTSGTHFGEIESDDDNIGVQFTEEGVYSICWDKFNSKCYGQSRLGTCGNDTALCKEITVAFSECITCDPTSDVCTEEVTDSIVTNLNEIVNYECFDGCLDDASAEMDIDVCLADANPTVWHAFELDENAGQFLIKVKSNDVTWQPSFSIFGGSCNNLIQLGGCNTDDTSPDVMNVEVPDGTNKVYVAVTGIGLNELSDASYTICAAALDSVEICFGSSPPDHPIDCSPLADFEVVSRSADPDGSKGLSLDGPFCPSETINLCTSFFYDATETGQDWLQGLIPYFGDAWDLSQFEPTSISISPNAAQWVEEGSTHFSESIPNLCTYFDTNGRLSICNTYCQDCPCEGPVDQGSDVPSGWFWTSPGAGPDCDGTSDLPENSFGFVGGTTVNIQLCLDLTIREFVSEEECLVSNLDFGIQATSDVMTGCFNDPIDGCLNYGIQLVNYDIDCGNNPPGIQLSQMDLEVCNSADLSIDVNISDGSSMDIIVVTDPNPNVIGLTSMETLSGGFGTFTQNLRLVEGVDTVQEVVYYFSVAGDQGCNGVLGNQLTVTIYPEIEVDFGSGFEICLDSCAVVSPIVTGGSGDFSTYKWSTGSEATSIEVCPSITTIYTLTITDSKGCEAIQNVIVNISPDVAFSISEDSLTICQDLNGQNDDGELILSNFGGVAPFSIVWTPPAGLVGGIASTMISIPGDTYFIDEEASTVRSAPYPLIVQVIDAKGCEASDTILVYVLEKVQCDPTSTIDEDFDIKVFPNPTKDWITIHSDQVIKGPIAIYDIYGHLLISTKDIEINVAELPSGIYFLKVDNTVVKFYKL